MLRLHGVDLHVRIFLLQHLADAGDGTAGADTGTEAVDGPVHLSKNLFRRILALGPEIVKVGELVRHIDIRVFCRHLMGQLNAVADALADVVIVVDENHLGAVLLHQFSSLLADGVRHDDDHPVALHRPHKG